MLLHEFEWSKIEFQFLVLFGIQISKLIRGNLEFLRLEQATNQ